MEVWNPENDQRRLECIHLGQSEIRQGDRVRLRPKRRADIFDMVLDEKVARVEIIEEDLEGRVHLAVTLDEDPGRDLGVLKQSGHRFFYGIDEVEPFEDKVPVQSSDKERVE